MPRTSLTLALSAVIALCAGAAGSWFTRPNSGVAVVDLDRVAKELGRDVQMTNDLRANQNSLASQLSTVEKNAVTQLNKIKAELGVNPEEEQLKEFTKKAQTAQVNFNNLQKKAVAAIGQRRDQLIASFRQETRPYAEKVAKAKGVSAVMTRNDAFLFSFDNTIDITDAVIAEMRLAPPPAETPAPAVATPQTPADDEGAVRQASASTTKPAPVTRPAKRPAKE